MVNGDLMPQGMLGNNGRTVLQNRTTGIQGGAACWRAAIVSKVVEGGIQRGLGILLLANIIPFPLSLVSSLMKCCYHRKKRFIFFPSRIMYSVLQVTFHSPIELLTSLEIFAAQDLSVSLGKTILFLPCFKCCFLVIWEEVRGEEVQNHNKSWLSLALRFLQSANPILSKFFCVGNVWPQHCS